MPPQKILLVTLEPIARQMAGPAIRSVELGKVLAREHQVTVFSPQTAAEPYSDRDIPDKMSIVTGQGRSSLYELAHKSDILFIQGNVLKPYPRLGQSGKFLVVDLYDPYLLSLLAQYEGEKITSASSYALMHQVLEKHMAAADFSLCASEKQLDYWLGRFCAIGRLGPEMYRFDKTFRKLIDVVPFGLPDSKPERTGAGIKGVVPGINSGDFLLVWGGGIWDWFDPISVIQAVALLAPEHPRLKLYFMGIKSPNPQVPLMKMTRKAMALSDELGLTGRSVFFAESWTPYEKRSNILLDADACVSAHFDLPETRFSFRTRILDYLWAGSPVLTTRGDQFADLIDSRGAGAAVDYESVSGWAKAIEELLLSNERCQKYRSGAEALASEFVWTKAAGPLVRFCREPYHSPGWRRIRMPGLLERARSVYERGGSDLVINRSKQLIKDIIKS